MTTYFSLRDVPLPKNWGPNVKSAVLHVVSLAHMAITYSRSFAANSPIARIRLAASLNRVGERVSVLEEELRIKDARMGRIAPHRRPYYSPTERMAILEVKAARGWSQAETARRFLVKPTTIALWLKRIDERGSAALVQMREPVNRFPQLVRYIVRRLKVLFPIMGKKRIAQTLARAGLHLGVTTVGRMLKEKEQQPTLPAEGRAAPGADKMKGSARGLSSKYPNHIWLVDLTTFPIGGGFWTPWLPLALPQVWPFCWWIGCAVDHYSRRVMGFALFKKPPTSVEVHAFLGRTMRKAGASPKYLVCDKGGQFWNPSFKRWCKRKKTDPRYGAVGEYGSIALMERFIRSLKEEWLRRIVISFRVESMRRELSFYLAWFNEHRPHQSLGGRTPLEVHEGRTPANEAARLEPRLRLPKHSRCAGPQAKVKGQPGGRIELVITLFKGRRQLPIVKLKEAA